MYLPRTQIAQLYSHLIKSTHPSSGFVLVLTSLTVDSLCATRILTNLFKRDFIQHSIIPVSGYADLQRAGTELVLPKTRQHGGDGATVICLGLGGAIGLEEVLGLDGQVADGGLETAMHDHGIEIWVIDSHRPWNLENVFGSSAAAPQAEDGAVSRRAGVQEGRITPGYKPGKGGVIVWDDGDLEEELAAEKEAYFALQSMPEITEDDLALLDDEDDDEDDDDEAQDAPSSGQKRKRSDLVDDSGEESDADSEDDRPARRRRSNSGGSVAIPSSPGGNPLSAQLDIGSTPPVVPSSPPKSKSSAKDLRRQLLKMRRKHEATLDKYYALGTSGAEPVSSMLYSLASELGREDNDTLWLAIVGISAVTISATGPMDKLHQIRAILQEEVNRLNPIPQAELQRSQNTEAIIPTTARSATDTSIRLSPEPKFLLIRHWSLYDSMLHSPYLATRLKVWNENGKKRLKKLLAKMGVSLQQAGKGYLHMDSEIKRSLRTLILKFAEQYNLPELVPGDNGRNGMEGWGFVRSWGWNTTLSADDVAIVVGAILEVGTESQVVIPSSRLGSRPNPSYNTRVRTLPTPPHSSDDGFGDDASTSDVPDFITARFFRALDALAPSKGHHTIIKHIPTAQNLYRAILEMGAQILNDVGKTKRSNLKAFRFYMVQNQGVEIFLHPGALVRLATWMREANAVLDAERGRKAEEIHNDALVLAALDDVRRVYLVIGLGGGTATQKIRSKTEIKAREERRKRRAADKVAEKADRARKRQERRRLRRERNAANGLDSDDDEFDSESDEAEETESDDEDSEDEGKSRRRGGLNRFGLAFQEVVEETGARVRIDSFEHSVVEVRKEDLGGFLEGLSQKAVVG